MLGVDVMAMSLTLSQLVASVLVGGQDTGFTYMSCTGWSGPGLCSFNDSANAANVSALDGRIGGMSGTLQYYQGIFSADIKFQSQPSAGIITAFYLIDTVSQSNKDSNHFEIDVEFYGSDDPSSIQMSTNVFFGGDQNLAQFSLPFDPSADFHTYEIIWNSNNITWLVDQKAVRVLDRSLDRPWPEQPLLPMFTVWPINWGSQKADYSRGPITSQVRNFAFQGCGYNTSSAGNDSCPTFTGYTLPWNRQLQPYQLSGLRRTFDGAVDNSTTLNAWGWDTA